MPSSCNDKMYELGVAGSSIRVLFAYGQQRKAQIGADKVYDFSLGNPSVPAPAKVRQAILEVLDEPSLQLHGYTASPGAASTRAAIAASLNRRFGTSYQPDNLYLTMGAAAALDASIRAVVDPGDEVICIAPFFPEYQMWIEAAGCTCVRSMADADMQPDVDDIASRITERTRAVIVDSPNNPTGAVYPRERLERLAEALRAASERIGRTIYLIADEPYREVVYDGIEVPWIPSIYPDTIVCYSYSKSLSLPGERIGYVLVPDTMPAWREVFAAVAGAGRTLGYVCAPSLIQQVVERCVDEPTDVAAYAANRAALTEGLSKIGYEYVEPQGAFYLWMKALEPDAKRFSERAKAHELLIVPSDDFGMTGYVRIGYCVSHDTIVNSMPAFQALYDEYRA
ncbi:MAG: pyridoxal phosphate-dependent aminotransferase [Coriobacteriales bacterium]|jgi:aspartate aminotransferase